MNRHPLLKLYGSNKGRGSFKAEGNVIEVYDVIVGSADEAEWFGGVCPEAFRAALAGMTGPVSLRINSPGGDVFGARAMEQAIRDYAGEVVAHVDGLAASAASLLVASSDRAVMAPGAMLMVHRAWSVAVGNAADLLEMAAVLEKIDGTIADTYDAKGGKGREHYAALMAAETWLTAEEAIADGLADEIAAAKPKATTAWDVSAYAKAPALPSVIEPEAEAVAPAVVEDSDRRRRLLAARLVTA